MLARRRLKLATWVGAPLAVAVLVWETMHGSDSPTVAPALLALALVAYTVSVYRIHELTGEWRFF
jgi:hypothetical protein